MFSELKLWKTLGKSNEGKMQLKRLFPVFRRSSQLKLQKIVRNCADRSGDQKPDLIISAVTRDISGGRAPVKVINFDSMVADKRNAELWKLLQEIEPEVGRFSQGLFSVLLAQEPQSVPVSPFAENRGEETKAAPKETAAETSERKSTEVPAMVTDESEEPRVLDTVLRAEDAAVMIRGIQLQIGARLLGRAVGLSQDEDRVSTAAAAIRVAFRDCDPAAQAAACAAFSGLVTGLLRRKATQRAVELAADVECPPLDPLAQSELVVAVVSPLSDKTKATALLSAMTRKDGICVAAHTCATALGNVSGMKGLRDMVDFVVSREESRFDPAIVHRTNAGAVQRWGQRFVACCPSPVEKQRALLKEMSALPMIPLHTALSALSVLAMSDVARPWLMTALPERTGGEAFWLPTVDPKFGTALSDAALRAVAEDPNRYLVHSRLLGTYARLLERDVIRVTHSSFPAFLEECGECYLDERPKALQFQLGVPPEKLNDFNEADGVRFIREELARLAPSCSFWTTLLNLRTSVKVRRVSRTSCQITVLLPSGHDSLRQAAKQGAAGAANLDVLYEDDDIVAFEKPAGLPTTRHALCNLQVLQQRDAGAAASATSHTAMTDVVATLLQDPQRSRYMRTTMRCGMLHRLDRDTSGVLLFAKNEETFSSLRHQMGSSAEFGHFPKVYMALCVVLEPDLGKVRASGVIHDPQDARLVTRFTVSKFFSRSRLALVECRIQQGKKHQIRRHLASIGMPILLDDDHGGAATASALMTRVALHAAGISFVHPRTTRPICIQSPLPPDFVAALRTLAEDDKHQ